MWQCSTNEFALPVPGWTGAYEWQGWRSTDDLPGVIDPRSGYVASANDSIARTRRLDQVFKSQPTFGIDDFKRLQHDTLAWNAGQLVPLLASVRSDRPDVEDARKRLLQWVVAWAGLSAAWLFEDGENDHVESTIRIAEIAAAELDKG